MTTPAEQGMGFVAPAPDSVDGMVLAVSRGALMPRLATPPEPMSVEDACRAWLKQRGVKNPGAQTSFRAGADWQRAKVRAEVEALMKACDNLPVCEHDQGWCTTYYEDAPCAGDDIRTALAALRTPEVKK